MCFKQAIWKPFLCNHVWIGGADCTGPCWLHLARSMVCGSRLVLRPAAAKWAWHCGVCAAMTSHYPSHPKQRWSRQRQRSSSQPCGCLARTADDIKPVKKIGFLETNGPAVKILQKLGFVAGNSVSRRTQATWCSTQCACSISFTESLSWTMVW